MAVNVSSADDADATATSAVGFFDADGCSDLDAKTERGSSDVVSTAPFEQCVDGPTRLPVCGN